MPPLYVFVCCFSVDNQMTVRGFGIAPHSRLLSFCHSALFFVFLFVFLFFVSVVSLEFMVMIGPRTRGAVSGVEQ